MPNVSCEALRVAAQCVSSCPPTPAAAAGVMLLCVPTLALRFSDVIGINTNEPTSNRPTSHGSSVRFPSNEASDPEVAVDDATVRHEEGEISQGSCSSSKRNNTAGSVVASSSFFLVATCCDGVVIFTFTVKWGAATAFVGGAHTHPCAPSRTCAHHFHHSVTWPSSPPSAQSLSPSSLLPAVSFFLHPQAPIVAPSSLSNGTSFTDTTGCIAGCSTSPH